MSKDLHPITMPKWGLSMKEGSISKWNKSIGENIKKGEMLLEIETEKVVNEMESPEDGTILKFCANEGDTVPVGSLIALYGESGTSEEVINEFIEKFNSNFESELSKELEEEEENNEKVKIGDLDINYIKNLNSKDKNILFIHGFGGDLNNWMFNQDDLSKEFNTYALDLPGHGLSSKTIKDASLSFLSEIIIKFCEENSLSDINLVGHSFGAGIAIKCASENNDFVKSLNLISPIGLGDEIDASYLDNFIISDSRRDLKNELEKLYFDPEIIKRDLVNEILKFKRIDGVSESLQLIKNEIINNEKQKINLRNEVDKLSIPTTIIWGKQDAIIPQSHTEKINEKINIKIIDDCGHMAHTEHPNEVNAIIRNTISS